ncbi:UNKNOWN [Stylonychia lemnae]|uniref:Transmembrane protein n=1 Tax=Stylonychia lemnae TaxID=5949 RepID=A0A077ZWE8_STYLE|nr:UNKNOWN [Stylonychia lemnae]|eukprot:CDW74270.1 UNKNOWN [Stylonychia lemnae]
MPYSRTSYQNVQNETFAVNLQDEIPDNDPSRTQRDMLNDTNTKLFNSQLRIQIQPMSQQINVDDIQLVLQDQIDRKRNYEDESDLNESQIKEINYVKKQSIRKYQTKKQNRVMLSSTFVILMLASYFIASYFMSLRTFQSISGIVDTLGEIYSKGSCLSEVINAHRENVIQNSSLVLFWNKDIDSFETKFEFCQKQSQLYQKTRRNIPLPLNNLKSFINQIESETACNSIYNSSQEMSNKCIIAYNGILKKGLQNSLDYFLSQILEQNLQFRAIKHRTLQQLKDFIADSQVLDMVETLEFVMLDMLNLYKQKATDTTLDYYSQLLRDYLILFSCFIVIMVILIIVFSLSSYKKIKLHMLRTNMTLKILPLENLSQEKIQELKKFFQ